jgi:crotonobetainyl-CoA:carnitine CoA-transferase CaiB-like acyl-CoA transferase
MGPDYPDAAGYDPAIQAMAGYMDVTGDPKGPPMLAGIPLVDLKAGDEVFAQVWMALAERAASGRGKRIDVSMFQAAASWLITLLPLIDFDCEDWELARAGNEHRKFVPTNAYPTRDGAILVAIGSDALWRRLCAIPRFAALARDDRATNPGRVADRVAIHAGIGRATATATTAEISAELAAARIPHAPILGVRQAMQHPAIGGKLTRTTAPDGRTVRMQPKAVDAPGLPEAFAFPPRYGEQTASLLREVGYGESEIARMLADGVAAGPEAISAR